MRSNPTIFCLYFSDTHYKGIEWTFQGESRDIFKFPVVGKFQSFPDVNSHCPDGEALSDWLKSRCPDVNSQFFSFPDAKPGEITRTIQL